MNIIPKNRLEAFSDGVIAIIITIMVLEIKVPHGDDLMAFKPLVPVIFSYVLSFIYVAIYWVNHHHLLHAAHRINAKIMWANMALLFWLSLIPFTTNWLGENHGSAWPTATYGFVLLCTAISYFTLQWQIIATEGKDSELAKTFGSDWKGRISLFCYVLAIVVAFIDPKKWISDGVFAFVALLWLIPDRRVEKVISHSYEKDHPRSI
jgi:uncharacterized membrane protein